MNKNHIVLLILSFTSAALADTPVVHVPTPVFFDKQPNKEMPSKELTDDKPAEQRLSDDLSADSSLEAQINRALIGRDWKTLEGLLAQYKATPDRDAVLYDYALGALRRSQLRHGEAVSLYRGILAKHPNLAYPRFDLGVMMFENKQYHEAKAELKRAKPDLQPPIQQLADRYLASIESAQSWQPNISLQYEQTDM